VLATNPVRRTRIWVHPLVKRRPAKPSIVPYDRPPGELRGQSIACLSVALRSDRPHHRAVRAGRVDLAATPSRATEFEDKIWARSNLDANRQASKIAALLGLLVSQGAAKTSGWQRDVRTHWPHP